MRTRLRLLLGVLGVYGVLCVLHFPLLCLPYFWDESGYYIPAALDLYRSGQLIPQSTLPAGHTPLVMIYLAGVWQLVGFSHLATRAAMLFLAALTVVAVAALGRRVAGHEAAAWSALLFSLSPLFFAQSSLAHLDLAVGLFTTLAVLALLEGRMAMFALAASLATLSKETGVVLLPVAWAFAWLRVGAQRAVLLRKTWIMSIVALLPLLAWTVYYHHRTGYWTGNPQYLQYNFYSSLDPVRIILTLLRRLYEVFVGGFNWVMVMGVVVAIWHSKLKNSKEARRRVPEVRTKLARTGESVPSQPVQSDPSLASASNERVLNPFVDFLFLAVGLCSIYVFMLSLVGGAVLPRYLLPIFPLFYLLAVTFVFRLPRPIARSLCLVSAACFVSSWFINPPYPFPFEDNLSYADFVQLHQQAAQFLDSHRNDRGDLRVLTAWPASDELARPPLGYLRNPLRVVPIQGFTVADFRHITPESFDLLYLYSRKWEPSNNWLARFSELERLQEKYFDYAPQVKEETLVTRFHLKLLKEFGRRGQWVRIYSK